MDKSKHEAFWGYWDSLRKRILDSGTGHSQESSPHINLSHSQTLLLSLSLFHFLLFSLLSFLFSYRFSWAWRGIVIPLCF